MIQPLDAFTIRIFMVIGAIIAAAGLYLVFRPTAGDGKATIELFGLKLNTSSGGLIIFLVGCAFLATPLFVPQRTVVGSLAPASGQEAGVPPAFQVADGKEKESNDGYAEANRLAVGASVQGRVSRASPDWFALATADGREWLEVRLRNGGGQWTACDLISYSEAEVRLRPNPYQGEQFPQPNTANTYRYAISDVETVFVALTSWSDTGCGYELFSVYAPE